MPQLGKYGIMSNIHEHDKHHTGRVIQEWAKKNLRKATFKNFEVVRSL